MSIKEDKLNHLLENLSAKEKSFLASAELVMKSGNAWQFTLDFIALSIINRAISLNRAFKLLVENNNMLAAVNNIRLQLDNLIRYHAIYIVDEPDKLIEHILEGQSIDKFLFNKQRLTDGYLVQKLNEKFPNTLKLYKHCCEFIHFGFKHFEKVRVPSKNPKAKFTVTVGDSDNFSIGEKIVYAENMLYISDALLEILGCWPIEKDELFK